MGPIWNFFYCEIARLLLSLSEYTTYLFFSKQNFNSQKTSINWIWRETLTTAAFNSAVMIKSDNKIYQDMVRGMMGLQVPSGGSVAFATLGSNSDAFGPEGQDDQGKVSWIIIIIMMFPGNIPGNLWLLIPRNHGFEIRWASPKALTKYERPKMKRDAGQKCNLFYRKRLHFRRASLFIFGRSYFVRALVAEVILMYFDLRDRQSYICQVL